jgi:hypothetical protein
VCDVHEELAPLLRHSGFSQVVTDGIAPPECAWQLPMLSLPRVFRTTLESIPAKVPYLSPAPERIEAWGARLGPRTGLRVGLHWQGSSTYYNDRARSIPLAQLAPLAKIPGVQWVSLQKSPGPEQLAGVAGRWPLMDLGDELADLHETAAVMRNLDLVIGCDSAPAHLAGALAVPVWVGLTVGCDWRWLQLRNDSPWYPTMRLFRQRAWGSWESVVAAIAEALAGLSAARGDDGK